MTPSDDRLIERLRAGDEAAFAAIHERYRPRLVACSARIVGCEADAEDVVQEVFERAAVALRANDQAVRLGPWLYRVTQRRSIDVLRARRSGLAATADTDALAELAGTGPDPVQSLRQRDRLRGVIAGLRALPERQRDALVLSAFEGRSHEEIAAHMGTSVAGTKSLVNRGRKALVATVERALGALGAPLVKVGLSGAVAIVTTPAVLLGGGKILSDQSFGPGDPSPRTRGTVQRGAPMPSDMAFVEADVELPAGEGRARHRHVRLTCPVGMVFAGGMSAGGGTGVGWAVRSVGLGSGQARRQGRFRRASITIVPRARLPRPAVLRVGIVCQSPARWRRERAAGRRLECRAIRDVLRQLRERRESVPPSLLRAERINC